MGMIFGTPDSQLWDAFDDKTEDRVLGLIQGRLDAEEDTKFLSYFQDGKSLMHRSIETCKLEVFKLLLDRGVTTNPEELTKYELILKYGWMTFFDYMLGHISYKGEFADPTFSNFKDAPIYFAVRWDHIDLVDRLLALGVDINATISHHLMRPCHIAAAFGSLLMFAHLIERGADITERTITGATCLMLAVQYQNKPIIEYLIAEEHTRVDQHMKPIHQLKSYRTDRGTALHIAAYMEYVDGVKLLLGSNMTNVNAQDEHDFTPLMMATTKGNTEIVSLLINAGANITLRNDKGLSAYDMARLNNFSRLYPLLIFETK